MKRHESRHFSEEELLMHFLGEETADAAREIAGHLEGCGECHAIFKEYGDLVGRIQAWPIPEISEEARQSGKAALLAQYRRDMASGRDKGIIPFLHDILLGAWTHALEHPLPTLGYLAVAVAFALERTISTFRLDRILPGASEVIQLLRQVF
jgi:anti-sigma factor RsiW